MIDKQYHESKSFIPRLCLGIILITIALFLIINEVTADASDKELVLVNDRVVDLTEVIQERLTELAEQEAEEQRLRDRELLANVMYHENYWTGHDWAERREAMLLTGSVVLNRVECSWCPDTIEEVLYDKGQYATTKLFFTAEIPDSVYELADELLEHGSIAPKSVLFQSQYPHLGHGSYRVICGEYFNYE